MTNPLAKVIIITGKSDFLADIYTKLLDTIPADAIQKCRNSPYEQYIRLRDGSAIRFVRINECARGFRCHTLYIQSGSNMEYVSKIFIPTVTLFGSNVYVINDFNDLYRPTRYEDYIKKLEEEI